MPEVNEIPGDNDSIVPKLPSSPTAELEAKRAAGLAKLNALVEAEKNPTAINVVPEEKPSTPIQPENVPVLENKEEKVPSQFQKPDGTLDEEKLNKSKQHLEEMKKQRLSALEEYKNLQREVTQLNQVVKTQKEQVQEPIKEIAPERMPESLDALKLELLADLEKDPAEALVKSILIGKKLVLDEIHRMETEKAQTQKEEKWLSKLDEHANTHPWIYSKEGETAIRDVLHTRPYLYQGSDPYGDALAFVDKSKFQSGQVETSKVSTPRTPILSGNRAVPPSVSAPVTDEQQLKIFRQQLEAAPTLQAKMEIKAKQDALVMKMFNVKF